jgi:hypothetical protein
MAPKRPAGRSRAVCHAFRSDLDRDAELQTEAAVLKTETAAPGGRRRKLLAAVTSPGAEAEGRRSLAVCQRE